MFRARTIYTAQLAAGKEFRKQGEVKFEWFQWNVYVWEFTCARESPWSRDTEPKGSQARLLVGWQQLASISRGAEKSSRLYLLLTRKEASLVSVLIISYLKLSCLPNATFLIRNSYFSLSLFYESLSSRSGAPSSSETRNQALIFHKTLHFNVA